MAYQVLLHKRVPLKHALDVEGHRVASPSGILLMAAVWLQPHKEHLHRQQEVSRGICSAEPQAGPLQLLTLTPHRMPLHSSYWP